MFDSRKNPLAANIHPKKVIFKNTTIKSMSLNSCLFTETTDNLKKQDKQKFADAFLETIIPPSPITTHEWPVISRPRRHKFQYIIEAKKHETYYTIRFSETDPKSGTYVIKKNGVMTESGNVLEIVPIENQSEEKREKAVLKFPLKFRVVSKCYQTGSNRDWIIGLIAVEDIED